MHNAVIAGYTRSPFTVSFKGGLKSVRPEDMLSQVIKSLISNVNLNKDDIEDVIVGCAFPEGEQGFNIGKVVTFMCDLPRSCLLYTSPSPRDKRQSRMPSSA